MNPSSKPPRFATLKQHWKSCSRFVREDIWDFSMDTKQPLLARLAAVLRVISISLRGLQDNSLFSRAASLSYASLLALGPLVAVVVVLSGAFIRTDAETQIKQVLLFIAPSLQELIDQESGDAEMTNALDLLLNQITTGTETIINQVNTAGSTVFGTLGSLVLIWIVIQLLTSVETTLNRIWGVRHGRAWSHRIVFYWTFMSLGVLLGLGSAALLSASNIAAMIEMTRFAFGMDAILLQLTPLLSFFMMVMLLTLFYRFFPNTTVNFRAAVVGGIVTTLLLILNNYLSILYVYRVISLQSLYGSVGIIPVLMVGLYFFWLFVLLGGQITYAVQNAHFLHDHSIWKSLSPAGAEMVSLATFLLITRRFRDCEPPPDTASIGRILHVPQSTINTAIEALDDMDWITKVRIEEEHASRESYGYRPAMPLEHYSLSRFRHALSNLGHSGCDANFIDEDPLLRRYRDALQAHAKDSFLTSDLRDLLNKEKSTTAQP
jgi:membrane protein